MRSNKTRAILLAVLIVGSVVAIGGVAGQPISDGTVTQQTVDAQSPETTLECSYPLEIEDDTGETITLDEEPEEIVVTNANIAQQIWELGAEEKVTGMPVAPFTAYLEGSEDRTNILEEGTINLLTETIINLEPDLVLSPDTTRGQIDTLRDAGLTVYQYEQISDLDHMIEVTERTGQLVGACEAAEELGADLRADLEVVDTAMADVDPVDVYYDQGYPFTVGQGALEHDVITRAGGNNVVPDDYLPPFGYGEVQSQEDLVEWNPEWLIIPEGAEIPDNEGIQATTAVQEENYIEVDPNAISQHGPRNIEVLIQIAETLHPDAMEDARDELETVDDEEDDDADDSGPGLTVGAAVAAIVGLALIAARRR